MSGGWQATFQLPWHLLDSAAAVTDDDHEHIDHDDRDVLLMPSVQAPQHRRWLANFFRYVRGYTHSLLSSLSIITFASVLNYQHLLIRIIIV
jgi:hypothetical protein